MNRRDSQTHPSLLLRIRDRTDAIAWREFYDLYGPLLYAYAREQGLGHDDADDIRSSCYQTIVEKIGEFDYSQQKAGFRAWLRTMVVRRVIDHRRKRKPVLAHSDVLRNVSDDQPMLEEQFDRQWYLHHLSYCVAQVGKRVRPETFDVFRLLVEGDVSTEDICRKKGMSSDQVYQIKSRFLKLVRQEMQQFLADAS